MIAAELYRTFAQGSKPMAKLRVDPRVELRNSMGMAKWNAMKLYFPQRLRGVKETTSPALPARLQQVAHRWSLDRFPLPPKCATVEDCTAARIHGNTSAAIAHV